MESHGSKKWINDRVNERSINHGNTKMVLISILSVAVEEEGVSKGEGWWYLVAVCSWLRSEEIQRFEVTGPRVRLSASGSFETVDWNKQLALGAAAGFAVSVSILICFATDFWDYSLWIRSNRHLSTRMKGGGIAARTEPTTGEETVWSTWP